MAIAFDAATDGGNNGGSGSRTFAHTCTGSDRVLFVGAKGESGGTDNITGATYNGVAMSLIGKRTAATNGDRYCYLFGLVAPDTGANNVVVSASSGYILTGAVSYTGVSQTGLPDASVTGDIAAGTDLTLTLTTVADQCWTVAVMGGYNGGGFMIAGSGTTRRTYEGAFGTWALFDSNGALSIGSTSLIGSYGGGASINGVMASFAPVGGGGGGFQSAWARGSNSIIQPGLR